MIAIEQKLSYACEGVAYDLLYGVQIVPHVTADTDSNLCNCRNIHLCGLRCESGESRSGGEAEFVARICGICRHGDLVLDLATDIEQWQTVAQTDPVTVEGFLVAVVNSYASLAAHALPYLISDLAREFQEWRWLSHGCCEVSLIDARFGGHDILLLLWIYLISRNVLAIVC